MRMSAGHAIEERATDEVAVLVALRLEAAAVDDEFGAFLHADVDVAEHLLHVLLGDQRPHLGVRIGRRADLQRAHPRRQRLDQLVGGLLAHRHRHRNRHAALAGRAVAGAHQRVGRLVHVGVGHHDHVVLGAAERLHALAVVRAGPVDVLGDRRRADEADRLDVGMVQDRVDDLLVAVHDVEDAVRKAGLAEQLVATSSTPTDRAPTASG
jgi:hypothetical protein